MLMYREDYYTALGQSVKKKGWTKDNKQPEEQPEEQQQKPNDNGGMSDVKILVAKNRNGSTGKVTLLFQKAYSRFDEPSTAYEEAQAAAESRFN